MYPHKRFARKVAVLSLGSLRYDFEIWVATPFGLMCCFPDRIELGYRVFGQHE